MSLQLYFFILSLFCLHYHVVKSNIAGLKRNANEAQPENEEEWLILTRYCGLNDKLPQLSSHWLGDESTKIDLGMGMIIYSTTNLNEVDAMALQGDVECVQYVERNSKVSVSAISSAIFGLDRLDQRELPLDNLFNSGDLTGAGSKVYIMDTGISLTQSEFNPNRATFGYTAFPGEPESDQNGHGTFVASIVAGTKAGVAKESNVVSVKILNKDGIGSLLTVMRGISYIITTTNTNAETKEVLPIINMSFGIVVSPILNSVITFIAEEYDMLVVTAAGNSNTDSCKFSPSSSTHALTVASTNKNDDKSSFSNYGECVTLYAPGEKVTGADFENDTGFKVESGTSFAAPYASGVAVLHREAAIMQANSIISPSSIISALQCDATPDIVDLPFFGGSADEETRSNRLLYIPPNLSSRPALTETSCEVACPRNCSGNGICNTFGRCICNPEFAGQECNLKPSPIVDLDVCSNETIISTNKGLINILGNSSPDSIYRIQVPEVSAPGIIAKQDSGNVLFTIISLCAPETDFAPTLRLYDTFWTELAVSTKGPECKVSTDKKPSNTNLPEILTLLNAGETYFVLVEGTGLIFDSSGTYGLTVLTSGGDKNEGGSPNICG